MAIIQKEKKKQKISIHEDIEKMEPLCPIVGTVKWCAAAENYIEDSQKIKHTQQFHYWKYVPRNENRRFNRHLYNHTDSSIAHSTHNNPNVHPQMNE
jgi:hypothetical protein